MNLWHEPRFVKRPFAFRFWHFRPVWRPTEILTRLILFFLPLQPRSVTFPPIRNLRPAARSEAFEKRVLGFTRSTHFLPAPPANLYVYTPRPKVAATSVFGSPGLSEIW